MYALADGGYRDDAELAFIQCFLQDERLQALLRVSCHRNTIFTIEKLLLLIICCCLSVCPAVMLVDCDHIVQKKVEMGI